MESLSFANDVRPLSSMEGGGGKGKKVRIIALNSDFDEQISCTASKTVPRCKFASISKRCSIHLGYLDSIFERDRDHVGVPFISSFYLVLLHGLISFHLKLMLN